VQRYEIPTLNARKTALGKLTGKKVNRLVNCLVKKALFFTGGKLSGKKFEAPILLCRAVHGSVAQYFPNNHNFFEKFLENFHCPQFTPFSPPCQLPVLALKNALRNHGTFLQKSPGKPSEITVKSSRNHRDFLQKLP
jgi:hypothetical protein